MLRWRAVLLGCVAGLGMEALFLQLAAGAGWQTFAPVAYFLEAPALFLGGFVAGHFSHRWPALHGAIAASAYIVLTATITAVQEARTLGTVALRPIDFPDLVARDLIALTAASLGASLAARLAGERDPAPPGRRT